MFSQFRSLCVCLGLLVLMASHGSTQGTLFAEDFDAYTGRRPEGWRLWGELPPVGNYFRVLNGALYTGNGDDLILEDGYTFATVDGADAQEWTDFTVEVDFRAIQYNGTILVVGRFQDSRNHYRAYFSISQSIEFGNERRAGIERVSDGERTLLGQVVHGREGVVIPRIEGMRSDNEWRRVGFAFRGDTIALTIDGEELLSVQDRTFRSGTAGVGQRFNAVYFDNFRVVAPHVTPIATALERDLAPGVDAPREAGIQEYLVESPDYSDADQAQALVAALEAIGVGPVETRTEDGAHRVVVGPFADEAQAEAALVQIHAAGHADMELTSHALVTITSDIQDIETGDLERIILANLAGLQGADRGEAEELMRAIVALLLKDDADRTGEEIAGIRQRLAELENQQELIAQLNRSITEEKSRQERIDELVAEISDAIDQQNWDQAEQQLERLRQMDPGNPHIDLKANALSLGRARITDLGAWINQAFSSLENRVQMLDLRTVTDVQAELQAAEELRQQSQSDANMLAQALVKYQSIRATADALLERTTTTPDMRNALEYARNQAEQHITPLRADYRNHLIAQQERQASLDKMAERHGTMYLIVLGLAGALVALVVALALIIRRQQKRHQELLDLVNEIPARPVAAIERTDPKQLGKGGARKELEASAGLFGAAGAQVGDMVPPADEPLMEDDDAEFEEEADDRGTDGQDASTADGAEEAEDEEKLIIGEYDDEDDQVDMEDTPTRLDEPEEALSEAPLDMEEEDSVIAFGDDFGSEEEEEETPRPAAQDADDSDAPDFDLADTEDMDFGLKLSDDDGESEDDEDEDAPARAATPSDATSEDEDTGFDSPPLDLDALGDMDFDLGDETEAPAEQQKADTGKSAVPAPSSLEETRPMDATEDEDALGMGLDLEGLTPLDETIAMDDEPTPEVDRPSDSRRSDQAHDDDDIDDDVDTLAMAMDDMDFDQEVDFENLAPAPKGPPEATGTVEPSVEATPPSQEAPETAAATEEDEIDLDGSDLLDFADLTPAFGADEDDEEDGQTSDKPKGSGGDDDLLDDISDIDAEESLDLSDILGDMSIEEQPPAQAAPKASPAADKPKPKPIESDEPSAFDLIDDSADGKDSADDPFAVISDDDDGLFDMSDLDGGDDAPAEDDEEQRR